MEHYAGIDVSLEQSSICVVDTTGRIVREAKVESEPEALVRSRWRGMERESDCCTDPCGSAQNQPGVGGTP